MINDKDYLNVKATLNSMSFVNEIAKRCVKLCRGPKIFLEIKKYFKTLYKLLKWIKRKHRNSKVRKFFKTDRSEKHFINLFYFCFIENINY